MSIPCLHQKLAIGGYLSRKKDKRTCSNDTESCKKIRKLDDNVCDDNIGEYADGNIPISAHNGSTEALRCEESPETVGVTSYKIVKSQEACMPSCCTSRIDIIQGSNDAIPTSKNIASTELDLPSFLDDNTECVDPNEITPSSMHSYLGNIFEFDILTGDEGNNPIFSSKCPEPLELVGDINIEKKFITGGKSPFQILNEYCQRELKAPPSISKIERHSLHDFTVEVLIKTLKYGIASGDTLKQAKHNAAASTLNILDYTLLNEEEPSSYLMVCQSLMRRTFLSLSFVDQ